MVVWGIRPEKYLWDKHFEQLTRGEVEAEQGM